MRIYRKSKGIKEPEIFYDLYINKDNIVGPYLPVYSENIKILDDKQELVNYISYEQYNKNNWLE